MLRSGSRNERGREYTMNNPSKEDEARMSGGRGLDALTSCNAMSDERGGSAVAALRRETAHATHGGNVQALVQLYTVYDSSGFFAILLFYFFSAF